MPWSVENPPSVAKNWTAEQKRKCVAAANAVLDDGGTDEDAIFACINAAGKSKQGVAMQTGEPLMVNVTTTGPESPTVAFVSASPNKIDAIRGQPLCGPAGETFRDVYLKQLGIRKDEACVLHMVPALVVNDEGRPREPSEDEIEKYKPWLYRELAAREPKVIVALGKSTRDALGELADTWLPHPLATRMYGDRGEVERKLRRVRKMMDASGEDVNAGIRRRTALLTELVKAVDAATEAELETVFRMPILSPDNGGSQWVEWTYHGPSTRTHTDTMPDGDTYTSVVEEDGQIHLYGSIMRSAIAKSDEGEMRLVTGVVMEPDEFDTHGDFTLAGDIEQAAYGYLFNSQVVGDQHSQAAPSDVRVVESYIAPTDFEIGEETVKQGSWVMTVQVLDDEMWEGVKSGKYTGFSIGGFAEKV
jgi:uracil-DNA glycosylase family 4